MEATLSQKITEGKSYNRGVRAHKLMLEALLRLKWEAFCQWAAQETKQIDTTSVDEALRDLCLMQYTPVLVLINN